MERKGERDLESYRTLKKDGLCERELKNHRHLSKGIAQKKVCRIE